MKHKVFGKKLLIGYFKKDTFINKEIVINNMDEQNQENKYPSLKSTGVSKPFWYLIEYKSNITLDTDENGFLYQTSEKRIALEEFNSIEEAQAYFDELNQAMKSSNLEAKVVYDYLGDRNNKK